MGTHPGIWNEYQQHMFSRRNKKNILSGYPIMRSYVWSTSHSGTSYSVLSQLGFPFSRRMVAISVIFDVEEVTPILPSKLTGPGVQEELSSKANCWCHMPDDGHWLITIANKRNSLLFDLFEVEFCGPDNTFKVYWAGILSFVKSCLLLYYKRCLL